MTLPQLIDNALPSWRPAGLLALGLALALSPSDSAAVLWNATDPSYSAVNVGGLTNNYGQFVNATLINNSTNNSRGTATYLKDGWFLTARHVVQNGGNYNALAPPSSISINVYGQNYTGNQIVEFGGADVALVRVSNASSGQITTLPGVERRQFAGPGNGLAQIGGFGLWGPFGSSPSGSIRFNRAFNTPFVDGPFLQINSNVNPRLIANGYVLGTQQSGDSGGPMWEANVGHDQSLDLYDWSLTGVTQTGGGTALGGSGGAYGFLQQYATTTLNTVYPHAHLTWNANPGAGPSAIDGAGVWDLTGANFTDGSSNFAFNGPERTERVTFGVTAGSPGVVTLADTIPVTDIVFNLPIGFAPAPTPAAQPASGTPQYDIAGGSGHSLALRPHSRITTNYPATISADITGGAPGALRGFSGFPVFPKLTKDGAATLTLTGVTTLSAGVAFYARQGTTVLESDGRFTSGLYTSVGVYDTESATLTLRGSSVFNAAAQDFNLGDLGGAGVLNVQDTATLEAGQLHVGKGHTRTVDNGTQPYSAAGIGTVNQGGGQVFADLISLGWNHAESVGTYNLSGGSLRVGAIVGGDGQSTFNFDGGTLTAAGASNNLLSGLTAANVGAGGAVLDTAGHAVTINQPLLATAGGTDGGLTKIGAGVLTLGGANTYTGPTLVGQGELALLGTTGYGATTIEPGATLSGGGLVRGDLTLSAGATLAAHLQPTPHDSIEVGADATLNGELAVALAEGFLPGLNDQFTVLTAGSLLNNLTLGGEDGGLFSLAASTPTEVILTAVSGLEGDYNNDGAVDALDYAVWREAVGDAPGTLWNDSQAAPVGQLQFDAWLANYGALYTPPTSGGGQGGGGGGGFAPARAPEPGAALLLLSGCLLWGRRANASWQKSNG